MASKQLEDAHVREAPFVRRRGVAPPLRGRRALRALKVVRVPPAIGRLLGLARRTARQIEKASHVRQAQHDFVGAGREDAHGRLDLRQRGARHRNPGRIAGLARRGLEVFAHPIARREEEIDLLLQRGHVIPRVCFEAVTVAVVHKAEGVERQLRVVRQGLAQIRHEGRQAAGLRLVNASLDTVGNARQEAATVEMIGRTPLLNSLQRDAVVSVIMVGLNEVVHERVSRGGIIEIVGDILRVTHALLRVAPHVATLTAQHDPDPRGVRHAQVLVQHAVVAAARRNGSDVAVP